MKKPNYHQLLPEVLRGMLAILLLTLGAAVAGADYPEFAAQADPPPPWPGRAASFNDNDATPAPEANGTDQSVAPAAPAPSRYATPEAAPQVLARADGEQRAAQRLPEATNALPLSPQTAKGKGGWADLSPVVSAMASLGIVLGLFLLVVLVVRRGMPKNSAVLPSDAVQLLGRAPLVGRQHLHLVRCGNKLLLLSVSAMSSTTLTEITDPAEVDRMLDLCQGVSGNSFRQTLGKLARPRAGDFSRRELDQIDFAHLEAYSHESSRRTHS